MNKEVIAECPLLDESKMKMASYISEIDYEVELDRLASLIGSIATEVGGKNREELVWICEMVYHLIPALREEFALSYEEVVKLHSLGSKYKEIIPKYIVVPVGQTRLSGTAHIIRSECRYVISLLKKFQVCIKVDGRLFDIFNSLSMYFLGIAINDSYGNLTEFKSRTY